MLVDQDQNDIFSRTRAYVHHSEYWRGLIQVYALTAVFVVFSAAQCVWFSMPLDSCVRFVEAQRGKKWSAAKHADQSVRTGVLRHTSYTTYTSNECA